ncbi:zinc-finger-containing protein [Robbsia sp. Bb-Pol-6]|uniref:Zinc-finger-containing protein n=1 Tax=Robbsia betulipollinis TaxID=2981849 RepID=A0ABT3ZKD3_9BURK|nr:zinc-finger-containing protein [Robbsia betulipollinis]MCY0386993.1 zinc-finger-containing protein [Robbsia betulipollinis]
MRVGRPVAAPPQPVCDYCQAHAVLARFGDAAYPYRDDHGALWLCAACEAWIGVRARSTRHVPLGRLANPALRDAKARLHAVLEPLAQAKVRRDGVNPFEARAKALRWAAGEAGLDGATHSLHGLALDDCERVIAQVEAFLAARSAAQPAKRS